MTIPAPPISFMFDREELMAVADQSRAAFLDAVPFPHIVLDNFLPPDVLHAVIAEFPEQRDAEWQRLHHSAEIKYALADTTQMGPVTRNLLAEFNRQVFVEFLVRMTGIDGLVPDPYYSGGGLHLIRAGGFLKVHADFNRHPQLSLDRRLNALLYLNPDWPSEYGGNLELWNRDMSEQAKSIAPIFNRLVVFATTDHAYHGHPEPLTCPPDRARRSMALYYYTNGRPPEEQSGAHSTLFQQRPGEQFKLKGRDLLRRWLPPAITDMVSSRKRE